MTSEKETAASGKWFELEHVVTFADTNVVGNVYFANYFRWQGECRELLMAESYPEFEEDLLDVIAGDRLARDNC